MEAKDLACVQQFVAECNDMLTGKFLDLNRRLEKLLETLAKSDDVIELLAEAIENFDEEEEFSKAFSVDKKTGTSRVSIPTDDKKKLALITTVFNRFTSGKENVTQFLETYFQNGKETPIHSFLQQLILPYRNAICKAFSVPTTTSVEEVNKQFLEEQMRKKEELEAEKQAEREQFPHLDELLLEVEKNANQILSLLKFEKKRTDALDDVEFVTNSILKACDKRDLMVINGLVIGLNYCSKKFKNIKHIVTDLNGMIFDYYEFLAGVNQEQKQEVDLSAEKIGFLE